MSAQNFCRRAKNSASFDCFRRYATEVLHTAGHWVPMVLQRRQQLFSTPCERLCPHLFLNWGGPLWRPWNPLRFWRLVLGPSMDKIFALRRDPLGRFTLFLISQLVSGSRVSLTQGRAGPAGVETAGREHGSCNHAVGE